MELNHTPVCVLKTSVDHSEIKLVLDQISELNGNVQPETNWGVCKNHDVVILFIMHMKSNKHYFIFAKSCFCAGSENKKREKKVKTCLREAV